MTNFRVAFALRLVRSAAEPEGSWGAVYDSAGCVYGAGRCARVFPVFPDHRSTGGGAVSGLDNLSPSGPAQAVAGEQCVS